VPALERAAPDGTRRRAFLTAEWRHLVMLNHEVAPALLEPYLPAGTELDTWNGRHYVSLVGFHFRDTRVLGLSLPFHVNFEEVNLRFYVRRVVGDEVRRGVTFIREIVPRLAIAAVARLAYNEPYLALPMRHLIGAADPRTGAPDRVEYSWRQRSGWSRLGIEPAGEGELPRPGSETEFITEHYWGYTTQRDGSTVEYRVDHPSWRSWRAGRTHVEGNLLELYGPAFAPVLSAPPTSAFLSEGSPVVVYTPIRL
jgi:uncharacterized protein YqjF (DUF2071 family)